ncbi:sugar transferase [Candidatus Parcubacteria bacterium]|jgi:exopolysaccharide biosynthesis polyprenyl glycosylphosphotransferase|nr:sugar transferase [Candidatus Parcubacteria bacterium]MBT7228922.1 sugar transferase [Candidatus Parcubacteria bacterium]
MKKADFITNISLVFIDFGLVILAGISAYFLRFSDFISNMRPVFYEMPYDEYLILILKIAVFAIIVFAISGFYTMKTKKLARELPQIITGVSTLLIFIVLAIFWQRELFSSRFIIILSWALGIIYIFTSRIFVFAVRNLFLKKGKGLARVIVLGPESARKIIVENYNTRPKLGFKVIDEFETLEQLQSHPGAMQMIEEKEIDNIFQSDSSINKDNALNLLTFCQENQITLRYVANLFQAQNLNIDLNSIAGIPIIEIQGTPLDGWRRVAKRTFDIIVSILLTIVLSPLFILIAIFIKTDTRGPVFVKMSRVGRKGRIFTMYKFRSMVKDAQKLKADIMAQNERTDGPLFKIKNDPRVTKAGRWLRKTSLDELPQLFNVIIGNMSLVGPRPHEPEEVSRYQKGYKKLLTIKPGMTGMAQVSGRANLLFAEEAKLDIFYIENWSLLLDMIILIKTPRAMLSDDQT